MPLRTDAASKYVGIDIGGTTVKGVISSGDGSLVCRGSVKTADGAEKLAASVNGLISELFERAKITAAEAAGIGIGCPGVIDGANGTVVFAGNLNLKNFPLVKYVREKFGLPVKITNDANAAALGEARFGAGKNYKDCILVTLGTGVGGGIIADGKLFEGGKSAGAEIGHIVIEKGGYPCTCGRRGCFECYASATALIRKTKEVMKANPDSLMWNGYNLDTVSGKTAFDYCGTDAAAKSVTDWYIEYLACGLTSVANVFRPQVIMLGGGVSAQGERLTAPVQRLLDAEIIGGTDYAPVKVVTATLGGDAGAYGAAALNMKA